MKTAAIIAECNPFHKGHEYLIRSVREKTGAERIIVLLSGNYVQRGIPAVTDRHVRAQMALYGGADLVLAYPTRFATASAEAFACHGVQILDRLGCVDFLAFGSESGDLEKLLKAAAFFAEEDPDFQEKIKENLKAGDTFAKARAKAAGEYGSLVSSPNNILAVEYLKALLKTGSAMQPFTVTRKTGSEETSENSGKAVTHSASAIREILARNTNLAGIEREIPAACLPVLLDSVSRAGSVHENDLSLLLMDRLRNASSPEELVCFQDVTPELARAAFRERSRFARFADLSEQLHTKNRTHSSVNRALLHIALGIQERNIPENGIYTQILGFRKDAAALLHLIKERAAISVVSKAADARETLGAEAFSLFDEELRVCDLYEGIRTGKTGNPFRPEIAKPPVII